MIDSVKTKAKNFEWKKGRQRRILDIGFLLRDVTAA